MKFARIAATSATLLCLTLLASTAFAATNPLPLLNPHGLALDSKGDLYVANYSANNVLVFNSSYVQLTAKTIKTGIYSPFGLAVDASDSLWVSNQGSPPDNIPATLTLYTKGVQNTSATIDGGAHDFYGLAIDGRKGPRPKTPRMASPTSSDPRELRTRQNNPAPRSKGEAKP